MSLALYRKYRPGSFAEVIGQEHVTAPLCRALDTGRVHHAYLFSGPRGCGKTSSARILARSLNCAAGPTPTPCGTCESCRALAPNGPGSLDVVEIDAASHGLVEDARDLRERAAYVPASSRYKIYIVDEAHMVSAAGFNALLKLVEEPPEHVKFVFATTEPEKVIATIRSRTFHYPFRLVPPGMLRDFLADICAREAVVVDPLVLPLVVRAAAGSVRDALSLLDQLLAGTGDAGLDYASALALLGYTDAALLDGLIDAVSAGDGASVFTTIHQLVEAGHDPRRFVADLLSRFRDLVLLAAVPDDAAAALLDAPADSLDRMRAQAARFGPAALSRIADLLATGLTEMRGATSPRLLLELLAARILLPAPGGTADLAARVERLERRLTISAAPVSASAAPAGAPAPAPAPAPGAAPAPAPVPAAPAPVPAPAAAAPAPVPAPAAPAPVPAPAAASPGSLDAAGVRRVWPEVVEAVKRRARTPAVLLADAQVLSVADSELLLGYPHAALVRRFSDPAMSEAVRAGLRDVLGVEWRVRAVHQAVEPESDPDPEHDFFDPTANFDQRASAEESAVSLLRDSLGAREVGEFEAG